MALPPKFSLALVAVCSLAGAEPRMAAAQNITVDGRFSPAQTLVGPNYSITANLGKQVGSNLFHSFGQFGLATGESAAFSGPATISNVIGRVTGGNSSSIDGKIQSNIAGANLYLINPSGIVFGPNATVNVSGSFHASTADYLKMSDGAKFQATNPDASTLSAAPPAAFGFLTARPAAITVNGSTLGPVPGTLGVVAGPVSITGATLSAPAGTIHVTSVAGTGEVPVDPRNTAALTVTSFGPVDIKGGSTLDVSDPSEPRQRRQRVHPRRGIDDRCQRNQRRQLWFGLRRTCSSLRGENQVTLSNGAYVHAVAMGSGNGAGVMISTAASGVISADASTVQTGSTGPGNGGPLSVETGQLTLTNRAGFNSLAQGGGNGGDISVTARSLLLDISAPVDPTTGLFSPIGIFSDTAGVGRGGSITIAAGQLTLHNGAAVLAQSSGAGAGGRVAVSVSGALTVDSGASLGTVAFAVGNAGDVSVSAAGPITIDMSVGALPSILQGIASLTFDIGNAGNVTVTAGTLSIVNNGEIASITFGQGNAGSVAAAASDQLTIDGALASLAALPTSIAADAEPGSTGNAGKVTVTAGNLGIFNGGLIEVGTFGSESVGSIAVNVAGQLSIDGSAASFFGTGFSGTGIFSDAGFVKGSHDVQGGTPGDITVKAGTLSIVNNGEISANIFGAGNAGNVTVNAGTLSIFNNGSISSQTFGAGKGGDVTVNVSGMLSVSGVGGFPEFFTGISANSFPLAQETRARLSSPPARYRSSATEKFRATPSGLAMAEALQLV